MVRPILGLMLAVAALSGCGERHVYAPAPAPVITEVQLVPDVRNPLIQSLTANPSQQAAAGQPITFQVVAQDPHGQSLQYTWSATGGLLSTTVGQVVTWSPPEKPGVYTVTVAVSNASGGMTVGSLNVTSEEALASPGGEGAHRAGVGPSAGR